MTTCSVCKKEIEHSIKGMCLHCYEKWYYRNSKNVRIKNKIGDEEIEMKIERDVLTEKEATKYIRFKQQQILNDALKNPRKYLGD